MKTTSQHSVHTDLTSKSVSLNYSVAKVTSILLVVVGHWYTGTLLWIPVTFGLFVFSFSSGYFTTKSYGANFNTKMFWAKKLQRLGVRFWTALFFIAALSLIQGRPIFHWHSIVHMVGMSGVLNWLSIQNQSNLGAGLWFFTLLLVFYICYPLLARAFAGKARSISLAVVLTVGAIYLDKTVKVGHELWLTALGFILGVAFGSHPQTASARSSMLAATAFCAGLAAINIFTSIKSLNSFFIAGACVSIAASLLKVEMPTTRLGTFVASADAYLLEVFLIHTYLFTHPTGNRATDLAISMVLILCFAAALHFVAAGLASRLFYDQRVKTQSTTPSGGVPT